MRIWIPEEEIRKHLPAEFKDYADTTVILDCTELRCQSPSSPLLHSETFSTYESHCTLKGLLGVAPHGAVTFISPLYAGSISDKQIMRESGILSLLRPGMAIMVDRGFFVDTLCLLRSTGQHFSLKHPRCLPVRLGRPKQLHALGCMLSASYAVLRNTSSLTLRFHLGFLAILISCILLHVS